MAAAVAIDGGRPAVDLRSGGGRPGHHEAEHRVGLRDRRARDRRGGGAESLRERRRCCAEGRERGAGGRGPGAVVGDGDRQ